MNTITRIMGIPVSLLLLTGCTVNAPVHTDVHDNYVDVHENTVQTPDWKNLVPTTPTNPMSTTDPNAPQDLPDSWGEDDVEPAPTFSPPSN
jgi:PBP1b-binding outer membrane lipoprotein LpoB